MRLRNIFLFCLRVVACSALWSGVVRSVFLRFGLVPEPFRFRGAVKSLGNSRFYHGLCRGLGIVTRINYLTTHIKRETCAVLK